ncbi:MAG: MerC domain-containing protein, partial [Myxococcota bacterium]
SEGIDRFGAFASSLCAVHCAVSALIPAAFGALGLGFLLGHEAEWVLTLVAIAFALGTLALGWRRHRSVGVALLLVLGVVGLLVSRGLEMGSEHHHGEAAHAHAAEDSDTAPHAPKGTSIHDHEPPRDEADPEKEDHHDAPVGAASEQALSFVGPAVGICAGLLLLAGHLLNLRALRRFRSACADDDGCSTPSA